MLRFNRPYFPLRPLEGDGLWVIDGDERVDGLPELANARGTRSAQSLSRQQAEPDFHLVEPRGMRGGEVQMHPGMLPQPAILLGFMRVEVVDNHMQFAMGVGCYHFVHEGQKIAAPTAMEMSRLHLPAGHLQGREEGGGTMSLVLVTETGEGLAVGQSQPALRALQSLNMRLLIDAQYHRVFRRMQVKPHDIGGLAGKLRVSGNAPGTPSLQADVVPPQGRPDPVRRHPQSLRQQP